MNMTCSRSQNLRELTFCIAASTARRLRFSKTCRPILGFRLCARKPESSAGIDQPPVFVPLSPARKADRTVWSNCSSLKGLLKNATAPACIARSRDALSL